MGGGGGSSSSSATTTTTQNVDKRMVVDNGVGVSSDSSTVTVTAVDLGAVSKAFEFAGESGKAVVGTLDKVLKLADTVLTGSLAAAKDSTALVSQAYETAENTQAGSIDQKTMMVIAGIGAAAYVATRMKK